MKFTIIYDNEVFKDGLKPGWGFSCMIKSNNNHILFDTGWKGSTMFYNLNMLGFDVQDLGYLVLSHWHWDHIGGLPDVLDKAKNVEVFVPKSFSENMKKEIQEKHRLHEIRESQEITENVHSTGELKGYFKAMKLNEQSLALETDKGIVVLTGCSHPDLGKILERASDVGKLYGVIGGFHGFKEYDTLEDLELIVPCHCTQHKKEIKERFPEKVELAGVGWSIEL